MTTKVKQIAKHLDIWEIIERPFSRFTNEVAVDAGKLKLSINGEGDSYLEIYYYPLEGIQTEVAYDEEVQYKKFDLSQEQVRTMYSEINLLVDLPQYVCTLEIDIDATRALYFDVKMVPILR
jgi:hypothetical protein